MNLIALLKPTPEEIERLAIRESDPEHYNEFAPIERGPLVALAILLYVGVAAVLTAPFRILSRAWRRVA